MVRDLSDKTRITVGLLTVIVGLAFWVGIAWAQIGDLQKKMDVLQSMDQRLSRIEGKLGVSP